MRKAGREWLGAGLITPFLLLPFWAETHTVVGSQYYNTFSRSHPVLLRIRPGDTVRTKLSIPAADDKGSHLANPSNSLTGPFFIEGAQPGDVIAVRLNRMRLNRNWGYSAWRLGLFSLLLPSSIEGLYSDNFKENLVRQGHNNIIRWNIDLDRKMVRLSDPATRSIH